MRVAPPANRQRRPRGGPRRPCRQGEVPERAARRMLRCGRAAGGPSSPAWNGHWRPGGGISRSAQAGFLERPGRSPEASSRPAKQARSGLEPGLGDCRDGDRRGASRARVLLRRPRLRRPVRRFDWVPGAAENLERAGDSVAKESHSHIGCVRVCSIPIRVYAPTSKGYVHDRRHRRPPHIARCRQPFAR